MPFTLIFENAQPFTAETLFFFLQNDISDPEDYKARHVRKPSINGPKEHPSQIRVLVGRPIWCVDVKRKIGVVPESCAHLWT